MTSRIDRNWVSLYSSAAAAVVVGFASTILVVMEGVRAVGASPAQQASAAAILCFTMAATSLILALRFRIPVMVAWSTPGAVLMATSGLAISFPQAIGAFIVAGALMVLTAFIKPLARAIALMPASIAAAMLAGLLLRYVLGVPMAALSSPYLVLPLVLAFFVLRIFLPIFVVPVIVALGLLLAAASGSFVGNIPLSITPLTLDWPQWNLEVMISLGLPLYIVTMASQNLPGFAVLQANGYAPPVSACLAVTGLGSILAAPFGGHAINLAAITASMVASPEAHPDSTKRWQMIYPYVVLYVIFGLAAGTFVALLGSLPKDLVTAIAGLALFGPLLGAIAAMTKTTTETEAALVTFLITASGLSMFGIGAAFWGLLAGLLLWGTQKLLGRL